MMQTRKKWKTPRAARVSQAERFLLVGTLSLLATWLPVRGQEVNDVPRPSVKSPLSVDAVQTRDFFTRLTFNAMDFKAVRGREHVRLARFPLTAGMHVDLDLARMEIFRPDARLVLATPEGEVRLPRPDVVLLSGKVVDEPESDVFLALSPHGNNGLIRVHGDTYILAAGGNQDRSLSVIYNTRTLPPGTLNIMPWTCEADTIFQPQAALLNRLASTAHQQGSLSGTQGTTWSINLAIETDWEFTNNLFGGSEAAAHAYVTTLIGAASEIYSRENGARFEIGYLRLWSTSSDPWTETNTGDQLIQFRNHWNSQQQNVDRDLVHFLSGRNLGGGIAYLGVICLNGWDYGLSANINGSFPSPIRDNSFQNWDVYVTNHELGHNFAAPHTHNMTPRIDNCAGGDCSTTPHGTIMSYCHLCPGGISNIELRFHQRIKDERILPFLNSPLGCDIFAEPPVCTGLVPPVIDEQGPKNRYLSLTGGNPGTITALRVRLVDLPPPFDTLNGESLWAGQPTLVTENSGVISPDDAPGSPTYFAVPLRCGPFFTDWTLFEKLHLYHEALVPEGTFAVQEIKGGCPSADEANYSEAIEVSLPVWGDMVSDCETIPCGPPDGQVDIITDVTSALDKFKNAEGAPKKVRVDLEPGLPDGLINLSDVTFALNGFRGDTYPFTPPAPCNE